MSQYHHKYFFRHIDRLTAEKYLHDQPELTFLLRNHYDANKKQCMAISIKKHDRVVHYQIPCDNNGLWKIPSDLQFTSLKKLIEHLQHNGIIGQGLLSKTQSDDSDERVKHINHVNINANATRIENLLIESDMTIYRLFNEANVFSIRYMGNSLPLIVKVFKEHALAKLELNNLLKLSCVNDKVNVPRVLTHNISPDKNDKPFSYLIMNRFPGIDLFEYVNKRSSISESLTKKVINQLLTIVARVHSCGIVHKDIKPENIIFDAETETIALIDFEGCETKSYCSPEQIRRSRIGKPSDVWAIGVVCYSMLSRNDTPFSGEHDILTKTPILNKCWSKKLRKFIRNLLVKEHAARPTCEEALDHEWFHEKADDG